MPYPDQISWCNCTTYFQRCWCSAEHQRVTKWKLSLQWYTTSSNMADQSGNFIAKENSKPLSVRKVPDGWQAVRMQETHKKMECYFSGTVKPNLSRGQILYCFFLLSLPLFSSLDWLNVNMDPWSNITRGDVNQETSMNNHLICSSCCGRSQDTPISLPIHIPQLVKSLLLNITQRLRKGTLSGWTSPYWLF